MKKLLIVSCCLLAIMTGCKKETKMETEHVVQLSAEEVNKKIRRKSGSFLLYLTTDECYSCNEYDKVLAELQKKELFQIYFVLVDDEDEEQLRELKMTLGNYETLPMTYYIQDGKVSNENTKAGYMEKDEYRQWLLKLDVIK